MSKAQITGDSGSGAKLGPFESRVIGVAPQIGYLFPAGGMQGYVNLKGYGELTGRSDATNTNHREKLTNGRPRAIDVRISVDTA